MRTFFRWLTSFLTDSEAKEQARWDALKQERRAIWQAVAKQAKR